MATSFSPAAGDFTCRLFPPPLLHPGISSRQTVAISMSASVRRRSELCRDIEYSPWRARLTSKADALYGKRIAVSNRSQVDMSVRSTNAPSNRMRFRVENYAIEIERPCRREQQKEVFECFSEQETLHRIGFLFSDDALQASVGFVGAAVLD